MDYDEFVKSNGIEDVIDAADRKDFGTDEFVYQLLCMHVMLEKFEVNL